MQVKYIVYCKPGRQNPIVDIWTTDGKLTHPVYIQKKRIAPQSVSSVGYLNFNSITKKWNLEHYQMDDGVPAENLVEFIKKKRIEKRDRLLVKRKIHRTPFLQDKQLQKETWNEYKGVRIGVLKLLFGFQKD